MTEYRVLYSKEALDDLINIYRYIAETLQAPQAARNQIIRIRKTIRSLSSSPSRFAVVDWEPWASMEMRQVPVNNYLVFYLIQNDDQNVTVVRVFYGRRNIEEIIKEDMQGGNAPLK